MALTVHTQVFEADKLRLAVVAPPRVEGGRVVAIQTSKSRTFIATEGRLQVWDRTALVEPNLWRTGAEEGNGGGQRRERLVAMLLLGDVLMALTSAGLLHLWDARSLAALGEEPLALGGDFSEGGVLAHPDTYLNKVLVGDGAGRLTLWNIRARNLLHEFRLDGGQAQEGAAAGGAGEAGITALEPSPAIDVVAVGRTDGRIQLVNLKYDRLLFTVRQEKVPVTSLAFRTDAAAGAQECPMLVSGGQDGQICAWDLKAQKLHSVLRAAHEGPVSRVYFFPREPLLLSASPDNSLRMWIFDAADGSARLLKHRAGHTAPPRRIRYYGDVTEAGMGSGADARGCQILSAGSDRSFRVFNTARDAQSREMSQGPLLKKARKLHLAGPDAESGGRLRPIRAFAATETRARDWCNVITCHESDCNAYVWRFEDRAIGKAMLRQPGWEGNAMMSPEAPEREAVCVAVTACGNYGLVGTRGGVVFAYNMQSGEPRGAFPRTRATPSKPHESMLLERGKARPGSVWAATKAVLGADGKAAAATTAQPSEGADVPSAGHEGPVTGVAVDSLNTVVITSGLDGTLRFWDFKTHALLEVVDVGLGIAQLEQARDSELLAAACDDFVIRVYDTTTRRLVRRLAGHGTHVSDLCFSRDGRRLVSASVDATVRVWDLPTGACVDWLRFRRPVTGVAMSHTGEYLCTSHVDRLGLYLWADRSFFQNVAMGAPPTQPYEVDEPAPLAELGDVPQQLGGAAGAAAATPTDQAPLEGNEEDEEPEEDPLATQPKGKGLLTLAMLPRAHWQTLFQLELIKQRNKPLEPPKAPPRAPFFLPTLHPDGVNPVFAPSPSPTTEGGQPPAEPGAEDNEALFAGMAQAWSDDDDDDEGTDGEQGGGAKPQQQKPTKGIVSSALNADVLPTGSRILKRKDAAGQKGRPTRSKLAALLQAGAAGGKAEDETVTRHLASLGPPQVDLEMQVLCLGSFDEEGLALVALGLRYLARMLRSRRHFEVVQAYLARFLRIYSPLLLEAPVAAALRGDVQALREAQAEANRDMKELVQHSLCLVSFFSNLKGV